jgi:predicted aspartyl protease
MIDSGVSAVIVDSSFAKRVGLSHSGDATMHSVAGQANGSRVSGLNIEIAGLMLARRPGFTVDLSPIHRVSGASIDVLLGRDIFEDFMVDIDFPSQKIAFHDPKRFRPPAGAISIPLKQDERGGVRTVPITLEGKPVLATFDLGAGAALLLSPRYAAEQGLLNGKRRSTTPSTGVEGTSAASVVTLDKIEFAGTTHLQVPATIPSAWQNDRRNIPVRATIGTGLLSRFRIISDYSSDRLWLVPNPGALASPFKKNRAGLHTVKMGDKLKVIHVAPGSPAAMAGWREGDEIVAVNGSSITEDFYRGDLHRWSDGPAGTVVELQLVGGPIRSLTLDDYY